MGLSKQNILSLAVTSAMSAFVFSANCQAEGIDIPGTFSANIAATSDYYFRGLSQTDKNAAIQGGFDWAHESGVYAGVWASSVSFGDTNIEVDTYAGYKNEFVGVGYDLGWIKYNYNDTKAGDDPQEFYVNLSYKFLSAGYAYSNDWFGTDKASNYAYLGAEYGLPYDIGISAQVGRSFGSAYKIGRNFEYTDYKIGINREFAGINFDLSYVDNDLSKKDCAATGYTNSQCDGQLILTASKAIDDTRDKDHSELPITANVTMVTDYYFRGISQTNNDGALQGSFDWAHESGFYIGIWGSNVAFGETTLEYDTYLGFANTVGDFGYDVGFLRYNYTETSGYDDPNEYYINATYSFLKASYAYSPNWFGTGDDSNYITLSAEYGLPYDFGLAGSVGYSFGSAYDKDNGDGLNDFNYVDYKVGVSRDFVGVTFDLSYIANNLGNKDCQSYGYSKSNCDNKFILSASKSF
jgi:uncharacterized protein (TIGR02001 family)